MTTRTREDVLENQNQGQADDVDQPPTKRSRKSNGACRRCHTYKIKCSGEQPCRNCRKSTTQVTCIYPIRDRNIVIKQSYVEQLEAEVAALRDKIPSHHGRDAVPAVQQETATTATAATAATATASPGTLAREYGGPQYSPAVTVPEDPELVDAVSMNMLRPLHLQHSIEGEAHVLSAYVGEAACEAFVTRVRQYLKDDEAISPPGHDLYFKSKNLLRLSTATYQKLPDRGYAMLLVDVADRMVGAEYHMFLRRPFMRRLNELYDSVASNDTVWLCGMFAIFALGEMYSSTTVKSDFNHLDIPGIGFFVQAMDLFQDLHEEATLPYIEVIILLSYYSHALNRRNTAYTLTGLALRLSLTLGLHRDIPDQVATGFEREHRRRVWWTVYILDRLCSLKLGHPMMIRDEDIDVELPSADGLTAEETEDLPDPQQLIASVTLARIAGNIVQELYCVSKPRVGSTLVQSVQKILLRLKAFANNLPESIRIEKIPTTGCPGRALASLHVYFNHCIILTTRLIFFHVFRTRFVKSHHLDQSIGTAPARTLTPLSLALSEACIHAATASHNLLRRLWINGLITVLGGFDAHYLFSAALILTMADFTTPGKTCHSILDSAWSMLKSMSTNGNLSAKGYYDQLAQLRLNLEEESRTKDVAHGSGLYGGQNATESQAAQSIDDEREAGTSMIRPYLDMGTYFDMSNSTVQALNDPSINDFLMYDDVNSLEGTGFEGLADPWGLGWERQSLPSTF